MILRTSFIQRLPNLVGLLFHYLGSPMDGAWLTVFLWGFRSIAVKLSDPIVDQLLILLQVELLIVGDRGNNGLLAYWLILGITELRQIWMAKCLLSSDSLLGVELQHLHEQIKSISRSITSKPLLQGLNLAGIKGINHR